MDPVEQELQKMRERETAPNRTSGADPTTSKATQVVEPTLVTPDRSWANELDDRTRTHIEFARSYAKYYNHGAVGHNDLRTIAALADMLDVRNKKIVLLASEVAQHSIVTLSPDPLEILTAEKVRVIDPATGNIV